MLSPRGNNCKKVKKDALKIIPLHKPTTVFGVPLSEVCEVENLPIPTIAEEVITYLENRGNLPVLFVYIHFINV